MYSFIKQGQINLIKSDRKQMYNVTKDLFQIKAFLLNTKIFSTKNMKQHNFLIGQQKRYRRF